MARPAYLVGRNAAVTIEVATDNGAGTLTFGTAAPMTGKAKSIRRSHRVELERVEPLDARRSNNVPILVDFDLEIEGLQFHSKAIGLNPLEDAFMTGYNTDNVFLSAYVRVVVAAGTTVGATAGWIWTYIGVVTSFEITIERGVPTHRLMVSAIDNGGVNPVLS